MELLSIYLKSKGRYIARQLSFRDVEFRLLKSEPSEDFINMYDSSCEVVIFLIYN